MFRVVHNTHNIPLYIIFLFSFLFLSFLFSPLADQKPFFSLFSLLPPSSLSPIFILFQPFITSSSFSSHCICPSSTKKKSKKTLRSPTITTTTTFFFFFFRFADHIRARRHSSAGKEVCDAVGHDGHEAFCPRRDQWQCFARRQAVWKDGPEGKDERAC